MSFFFTTKTFRAIQEMKDWLDGAGLYGKEYKAARRMLDVIEEEATADYDKLSRESARLRLDLPPRPGRERRG